MIGTTYRVKAAQSLLGSAHSPMIPAVLWSGWLDGAGALVAMTGMSHPNADVTFGDVGGVVTNAAVLDCGVAGTGWTLTQVGFFDAPTGALVIAVPLDVQLTPAAGDPLVIAAGALTFTAA